MLQSDYLSLWQSTAFEFDTVRLSLFDTFMKIGTFIFITVHTGWKMQFQGGQHFSLCQSEGFQCDKREWDVAILRIFM